MHLEPLAQSIEIFLAYQKGRLNNPQKSCQWIYPMLLGVFLFLNVQSKIGITKKLDHLLNKGKTYGSSH